MITSDLIIILVNKFIIVSKKIKINFILPFKPRRPAGGFRVMYEYANRLYERGYDVHLTYPIRTKFMKYRFPYFIRRLLSIIEGFHTSMWFTFHKGITMSYVSQIEDKYVSDADIVIATWWSTVLDMGGLSPSKGKKINLIQGFENWEGHEDLLYTSYDIKDTTNVVVASYLGDIVKNHTNNPIVLINNGVNGEVFYLKNDISQRSPSTVAMVYSEQEIKGSKYGLEALEIAKEKITDLQVELFGVYPEPERLPSWIKYYRNPDDLAALYNRNAIFISNSFTEGFGLVSIEAMFCGCAVVATDIMGHRNFCIEGETALLVEPGNSQQMADKIYYLIKNDSERIKIAERANEYVQRFKWENAVSKMDSVIKKLLE